MTTEQILHRLIGDVREQQVAAQAAIKSCGKKYTEVQTIVYCARILNKIDNILRSAERSIE